MTLYTLEQKVKDQLAREAAIGQQLAIEQKGNEAFEHTCSWLRGLDRKDGLQREEQYRRDVKREAEEQGISIGVLMTHRVG